MNVITLQELHAMFKEILHIKNIYNMEENYKLFPSIVQEK